MKARPSTLLLILAAAGILTVSSCTRKYICHCNITYTGSPALPGTSAKEFDIRDSKSNADSKCQAESGTYHNNNITSVDSCYLY